MLPTGRRCTSSKCPQTSAGFSLRNVQNFANVPLPAIAACMCDSVAMTAAPFTACANASASHLHTQRADDVGSPARCRTFSPAHRMLCDNKRSAECDIEIFGFHMTSHAHDIMTTQQHARTRTRACKENMHMCARESTHRRVFTPLLHACGLLEVLHGRCLVQELDVRLTGHWHCTCQPRLGHCHGLWRLLLWRCFLRRCWWIRYLGASATSRVAYMRCNLGHHR